ncbi:MAG TPA: hypothetical protein VE988_03975 [Gemmataceae bacterium]|nr:hypothetical protein [Gemmataceae bacterium]
MSTPPHVQINAYKGINPRCWVHLRFVAIDGSLRELDLVADTGSPCGVILGQTDLALLAQGFAAGTNSNFGYLAGAWLELQMPELGINTHIMGYGSDAVLQAVRHDSADFAGLVGLPLLRMVEYGGDAHTFWVRKPPAVP